MVLLKLIVYGIQVRVKATRATGFADSTKQEFQKQKDMKKSREERRNALCEELGRGC